MDAARRRRPRAAAFQKRLSSLLRFTTAEIFRKGKKMGLCVYVYRHGMSDCTNNGASARYDQLTVTNIEGPFEPTPDRPAAKLVRHPTMKGHCYIVPDEVADRWHMMGGNYAATSDSRFHQAVRDLVGISGSFAVGIHDRVEA